MKKVTASILAGIMVLQVFSIFVISVSAETDKDLLSGEYVPGEIIVKFKAGIMEKEISRINSRHGASLLSTHRGGFKRISTPHGRTISEMIEIYQKNPNVEYAEPNYIAYAYMVPNDPYYSYQWHLHDDNEGGIDMEPTWDIATGSNAIVAVVDTGVAYEDYGSYYQAPDLAGTTFVAGYDFVNGDTHPNDDNSHGTHCSGTVAQTTNNNLGVAGVAFNAKIMPVKVLNSGGTGSFADVCDGIEWAADNGANIISLSLGASSGSTALKNAVAYAYNKGVTVIAASGNDYASSVSYPAAYDAYVIAVGATKYDKTRAAYSNYGSSLDVVAPGGDLDYDQNGDGYGDGVLQNTFNPTTQDPSDFGYYFFDGTSMATPHVAGVAALLYSNGVTSPDDIRDALQSTAIDLGPSGRDNEYGYGLIDAYAALQYGAPPNNPPDAPSSPNPANGATGISLNPTLSVYVSDPDGDSMDVTFYDASDSSVIGTDSGVASGGTASTTWSGLSYDTTYSWYAIADDGKDSTQSATWSFTTESAPPNNPPDAPSSPNPANGATGISINPTLSVYVSDPDGDSMDVTFYDAADNSVIGTDSGVASGGTASTTWSGLSYDTTYSWYAIADDGIDSTQSSTWSFTTESAPPPPSTYSEDFEDAVGSEWSAYVSSTTYGRNERSDYSSNTGTYGWRMDVTSNRNYNLNELILYVTVSGASYLDLTFATREYRDERNTLPSTFTDHSNGDGVAVSTDGTNWVLLWQYPSSVNSWTTYGAFDIAGYISINGDVYIKFQQYDNYAMSTDGIMWDDIELESDGSITPYAPEPNNPPDAPSSPNPANGATGISINPTLSVYVSDPDGDSMDVTFYDASDSSVIGTDSGVASGGTASTTWSGLSYSTSYSWYAIADDGKDTTQSTTWSFTTIANQPPNAPINPVPIDDATGVDLSPVLSVDVSDPDGHSMDVTFYDASDHSVIGTDYGVPSGGIASTSWSGLTYSTIYSWYTIANDSYDTTQSATWSFITKANQPPATPSDPDPIDGASAVDLNPTLSVYVSDPDGHTMSVSFYEQGGGLIGTDSNVASGTRASVSWSGRAYNTTYYWYTIADDGYDTTQSLTWEFTTIAEPNNPPEPPTNPVPADGATNIGLNPTLSVDVSDLDGDSMDVTFYDANDHSVIGTDYSVPSGGTATTTWSGLTYETTYNWYTKANDGKDITQSASWSFTTEPAPNNPPNTPSDPDPVNGATGVSINPTLSVLVSDPDGDTMTVSFYEQGGGLIGTDSNVASGTRASVDWPNRTYDTTYSWYAIANDGQVDSSQSPTWSFTTETEPQLKMHVYSIDMSIESRYWGYQKRAVATVTIVDVNNNPVEGATVSGHWSGLTSDTDSGVTDTQGKVTLYSNWVWLASGTFTFTVDNVEKTGWIYDEASNVETSDSITV